MPPQGGLPTTGSVEPDAFYGRDNDPAPSSGGQLPSSAHMHRKPPRGVFPKRRGRLPYRGVGLTT
eukprot:11697929-Heterocapsa_arctica.AAC.1